MKLLNIEHIRNKFKESIYNSDYQYGYEIIRLLNYGYLDDLIVKTGTNKESFLNLLNSYIDYIKELFYFHKNDVILLIVSTSLKSKYSKVLLNTKLNKSKTYIEFSKMIIDNFVKNTVKYKDSFDKIYRYYNLNINKINLNNHAQIIEILKMYIKISYTLLHEIFMNKFIMNDNFDNYEISSLIYGKIISIHFKKINMIDSLDLISFDFIDE